MPIGNDLNNFFPGRVLAPARRQNIPDGHLVYVLALNDQAPAVVAGKRSPGNPARANVIFDDLEHATTHYKAMLVRLHHLFNPPGTTYSRYLITCANAAEAGATENTVHRHFNGDNPDVPPAFRAAVLNGFPAYSAPWTLLCCAMASAYDGIYDLRRWRKLGLINDADWQSISVRLQLHLL
jgi:hypothetical protein